MSLGSGSTVDDIAVDRVSSAANPVTWSFAKGVGFTDIGVGGQSIQMSSFSVNTQSSSSITRQLEVSRELRGHVGRPDIERAIRALLGK